MVMHAMGRWLPLVVGLAAAAPAAQAVGVVAHYGFQGTLAADQPGAPALVAIDPLGTSGFETATVGGTARTVYAWRGDGSASPRQAGLSLDTRTLLPDAASWSVALSFEFARPGYCCGWTRIVDTEARQSDNGFYVDPLSRLHLVQGTQGPLPNTISGSTAFTIPGFHEVLLSVGPGSVHGRQQVRAWLDGQLEVALDDADTFSLDNPQNPGRLLGFFADNLFAGAQLEYADGRIASLTLFDGVVTPSAVPEPAALALWAAGLGLLGGLRRGRRG